MVSESWYRKLLKEWVPPILIKFRSRIYKKTKAANRAEEFSGEYPGWEAAKADCSGYDDLKILAHCKNALLRVKNAAVPYERDGVVFEEIQYSWPLLAGLQKAALEHDGHLSVLDFGGSLGSSFFQNCGFLAGLKSLSWSIVEQKHFVDCGKENFENGQLRFYHTIEECLGRENPGVLLLSGVLQYLEDPYIWLNQFNLLKIPYIILDRTSFVQHPTGILVKQQIPEHMYAASYPAWFFPEDGIKKALSNYELLLDFPSYCDPADYLLNGKYKARWKGMIFGLKD